MKVSNTQLFTASRVFVLIFFPLICILPIWLVLDPSIPVQQLLVFIALAPHVTYPIVWLVGTLQEWIDVQEHIGEFLLLAGFSGIFLPILILVPVIASVDVDPKVSTMMLGFAIALLSSWIPLVISSLWSRVIVDDYEEAEGKDHQSNFPAKVEMTKSLIGIFAFLSVPLGVCLAVLIDHDHSPDGEATLIALGVLVNISSFFYILAPPLGNRLYVGWGMGYRPDVPKCMVKMLWGMFLFPCMILLPIYQEVELSHTPRTTLLACMLGLPPVTACEILRTYHSRELSKLTFPLAILFLAILLPFGIMLPIFLDTAEPSEAGETAMLAVMLGSPAVVLLALTIETIQSPSLPFMPLDYLFTMDPVAILDWVYAGSLILLPVIVLLPLYTSGDLYDLSKLTVISFLGVYSFFLLIMFGRSLRSRAVARDDSKYSSSETADIFAGKSDTIKNAQRVKHLDTNEGPIRSNTNTATANMAHITALTVADSDHRDVDSSSNNSPDQETGVDTEGVFI
eukprot:m.14081 g.14081  ORF g.14081 m.14081 type:complete len:511 (-) comp4981_c0_seq1:799-2331(-)